MGMLEVLPECRRKGLALTLETFLANRMRTLGKIPFAQIASGNEASIRLHLKLGFSLSSGVLCWLFH